MPSFAEGLHPQPLIDAETGLGDAARQADDIGAAIDHYQRTRGDPLRSTTTLSSKLRTQTSKPPDTPGRFRLKSSALRDSVRNDAEKRSVLMELSRRQILTAAGLTGVSLAFTPMWARADMTDWRAQMLTHYLPEREGSTMRVRELNSGRDCTFSGVTPM